MYLYIVYYLTIPSFMIPGIMLVSESVISVSLQVIMVTCTVGHSDLKLEYSDYNEKHHPII